MSGLCNISQILSLLDLTCSLDPDLRHLVDNEAQRSQRRTPDTVPITYYVVTAGSRPGLFSSAPQALDAVAGTQGAFCQQFTLYDEAVTHWRKSISQRSISVLARDSGTPHLYTPDQFDTHFVVVKGYVPGIYAGADELVRATANTAGVLYFGVSCQLVALKAWRVLLTTNRVEILPRDYVPSRADLMRGQDLRSFLARSRWWHQPTDLTGDRHQHPFWVVVVGRAPGIYDSW